MGHSLGSRTRRHFPSAHGVHDQTLALRTILHHGGARICARGAHRQSSPRCPLVPYAPRPGDGLRVSRVRAGRSHFPSAGSFFDAQLRLAPCPGDCGLAHSARALSGGDLDYALHSGRNGSAARRGGKRWPDRREE